MTIKKYHLIAFLLILVIPMANYAGEKKVDDYIIYYNAFNSSFLQPEVAKAYNIPRSGFTAVLNLSVHKRHENNTTSALSANVQGRTKNNLSQFQDLAFKEIKEDQAIYYLADFSFRHQESTSIEFTIRIPGREKPITISFDQKFFAD